MYLSCKTCISAYFMFVTAEFSCMRYTTLSKKHCGKPDLVKNKADSIWWWWQWSYTSEANRIEKWKISRNHNMNENKTSDHWIWKEWEGKCENGLQSFRKWIRLVWRRKRFLISWTAWPPVSSQHTLLQLLHIYMRSIHLFLL